jgi:hypothetical protein
MIRVRGEESAHRRLRSTASVEALVGGASLGFAPLAARLSAALARGVGERGDVC